MLDSHELHDAQMFFGLWFPSLVAINHQDARIDSANASQHVADESSVARNIDECDAVATGQLHMRKTKVDGETTFLFFDPAIRIDASKSANQC
ncbi:unannotated protein [freshwater metagenome]|uniref:Unannotated protein n=1 Tax=freshwater metagenome TaxID=449393 RepID=A0A6J6W941_9ZZZZ